MMSIFARDMMAKGIQKGLREGETRALLRLLQHRFGPAPDWVKAKLNEADLETLERWNIKLWDAESLPTVFQ